MFLILFSPWVVISNWSFFKSIWMLSKHLTVNGSKIDLLILKLPSSRFSSFLHIHKRHHSNLGFHANLCLSLLNNPYHVPYQVLSVCLQNISRIYPPLMLTTIHASCNVLICKAVMDSKSLFASFWFCNSICTEGKWFFKKSNVSFFWPRLSHGFLLETW